MGSGERFDELSRIWARPMSRRRALRLSAGVVFGAMGANLLAMRPGSAAPAPIPCTTNGDCPPGSVPGTPVCVSGQCAACTSDAQCGPGNVCGPFGAVCTCLNGTGDCNTACCSGTCCTSPATCTNPSTGVCTCPAGAPKCGSVCCATGQTCSYAPLGCCCPSGSTPCGQACCAKGVACLDRANSICGCQSGTTPCGTAANLKCCPPGTACSSTCPGPSNNTVPIKCFAAASDRNLKEHVAPVRWDRAL